MDNRETKAFGAFLKQLARIGMRQALPLEIYVRKAGDSVREIRREIMAKREQARRQEGVIG
jgi:hypothetical protein